MEGFYLALNKNCVVNAFKSLLFGGYLLKSHFKCYYYAVRDKASHSSLYSQKTEANFIFQKSDFKLNRKTKRNFSIFFIELYFLNQFMRE